MAERPSRRRWQAMCRAGDQAGGRGMKDDMTHTVGDRAGTRSDLARLEGENDVALPDPSLEGSSGAEAQGNACAGSLMG